jgi:5-formyltetrahydrofolate cyclo-ligase
LSHPEVLTRQKAALRAEILRRRAETAARSAQEAALAVADRLMRECILPAGAVTAGYWPLAGELDPRPAMQRLTGAGHRLVLPRMQGPGQRLAFHAWPWDGALLEGGFRVMEPDPAQPLLEPDLLLVPLVAFDSAGRRLGYGKGYYDRTLLDIRSRGSHRLAIGLAFAIQEVEEVPAGPSDQLLDAVVTEQTIHRCRPSAVAGPAPSRTA